MQPQEPERGSVQSVIVGQHIVDAKRVDALMALQSHRNQFRDHAETRFRAVLRDIDAWFAREVSETLDDPHHVPSMEPPRTIYDIEPPF